MAGRICKLRPLSLLPLSTIALLALIIRTNSVLALRDGTIRLVGGRGPHEGTILIYHMGYWGAVCDREWDRNDAHVVCKQLGYIGEEMAWRRSYFGPGHAWMWMSHVRCYGNEKRLDKCRFPGWGRSNCRGGRTSAGVTCIKPTTTTPVPTTTTPAPTTTRAPVTLGPNSLQADEPNQNATEEVEESIPQDGGDSGADEIITEEQPATTFTTLISRTSTAVRRRGRLSAWRRQRKRIRKLTTKLTAKTTPVYPIAADMQLQETNDTKIEMRLRGGRFPEEGRLEIKIRGRPGWYAICGDNWGMLEGLVVCKQLGLGYPKVTTATNFYGGERLVKIIKNVKCTGKEDRLEDCQIQMRRRDESCNYTSSIAGVFCTKTLPDLIPNATILEDSAHLRDHHLYYLQCAMEENCLARSAYKLKNTRRWISSVRRLLRFSSIVHNRGTSDFRPIIPKERWDFHECHMHYHSMEVFAHYDVFDKNGVKVAEGHKASFCLEDSQCDPGTEKRFQCKGFADQGISVNCSDNYLAEIDCQWVDITDLSPGSYIFRVHVNPELKVAELNYDNNMVTCDMSYGLYKFKLENCTHGLEPLPPTEVTTQTP